MGHIKEEDYRSNTNQRSYPFNSLQPPGIGLRSSGVKQNMMPANSSVMRMSKQSHATAATANFRSVPKRKRGKKVLTERNDQLRLPKLDSAYLRHPGEGTQFRNVRMKSTIRKELNKYVPRICGLCGVKHLPGEPHRARNAATFNYKSGFSRPPKAPKRSNLNV